VQSILIHRVIGGVRRVEILNSRFCVTLDFYTIFCLAIFVGFLLSLGELSSIFSARRSAKANEDKWCEALSSISCSRGPRIGTRYRELGAHAFHKGRQGGGAKHSPPSWNLQTFSCQWNQATRMYFSYD